MRLKGKEGGVVFHKFFMYSGEFFPVIFRDGGVAARRFFGK